MNRRAIPVLALLTVTVAALFVSGSYEVAGCPAVNEGEYLVPCLSYHIAGGELASKVEQERAVLGLVGRGSSGGRVVAEALVLADPAWAVAVQMPLEGEGRVVLTQGRREPDLRAQSAERTASLPRALAQKLAEVWRSQLLQARYPTYMLPPADTLPGGCLDGTAYLFSYGGACAKPYCGYGKDSPSALMVDIALELRALAERADRADSKAVARLERLARELTERSPKVRP